METFSALLAICAGNSPVPSPHKGQLHGAMMFSLICTQINGWVNNDEACDLRRHRAHYDVTVMMESSINGVPYCYIFAVRQGCFTQIPWKSTNYPWARLWWYRIIEHCRFTKVQHIYFYRSIITSHGRCPSKLVEINVWNGYGIYKCKIYKYNL